MAPVLTPTDGGDASCLHGGGAEAFRGGAGRQGGRAECQGPAPQPGDGGSGPLPGPPGGPEERAAAGDPLGKLGPSSKPLAALVLVCPEAGKGCGLCVNHW